MRTLACLCLGLTLVALHAPAHAWKFRLPQVMTRAKPAAKTPTLASMLQTLESRMAALRVPRDLGRVVRADVAFYIREGSTVKIDAQGRSGVRITVTKPNGQSDVQLLSGAPDGTLWHTSQGPLSDGVKRTLVQKMTPRDASTFSQTLTIVDVGPDGKRTVSKDPPLIYAY